MLASQWANRKATYDFVVVGSGYGGAITAARLASADLSPKPAICILERGREWPLGSFPDRLDRVTAEERSALNPLGLYETVNFRDISVMKASGLGGGSLINFNVALVPDPEVFELSDWPRTLRRDTMEPYYRKVAQMLRISVHPRAAEFPKFQALDRAAQAAGARAEPVPLTLNFDIDGVNEHGMRQAPCNGCGDCYTGCNYGGKNSLYMNYLPMAQRAGAEIYTQTKVEWVEKLANGSWRVHGRHVDGKRETPFELDTRHVVLAAGSLNSTEILLRSEMHGLKVSPRLGSGFSGNGDFFGIAYNSDHVVQALGIGSDRSKAQFAPGPAMVAVVKRNGTRPAMERFIIEEAVIPSAYVKAAQLAMAAFRGEDTDTGDEQAERARVLHDLGLRDAYTGGALRNTLFFMVTSMDDGNGSIVFDAPWWEKDGRIRIQWDDAGRQSTFARINTELRRMARELGSTYIENASWSTFNLRRLVTLHPLGGCPVGEDYMHGAADEFGRLFAGDGSVHEGLFVADGALLPSSIGANPLMTISAMAERVAERKIEQLKGREYPSRPVTVSFASVRASDLVGVRDEVLERLFRRAPHVGSLEQMANSDAFELDVAQRQIRNKTVWKGYLPKGLPLNELSTALFSGYYKRVWKEGERWLAMTGYLDGRVPVPHTLEEITIDKRTNDLDPGRYILLRYTDALESVFYDVLKMVSDDVVLYRGYTGQYPNGIRGFTAPLLRSYGFEHMSALDHQRLYEKGSAPTPQDVEGTWRMDAVANANHASGVAWLRFDSKPDGRMEVRYQLLNAIEGLVMPSFLTDHFQLHDFTPFHDEIRKLDKDLLIGKYVTELPSGLSTLMPSGSLGLLHAEPASQGRTRLAFYYLLTRAAAGEKPPGLFDTLLDVRLPAGLGITFEERMEGTVEGGACHVDLKIEIPDLAGFLADSAHEAACSGTLTFASLPGQGAGTFTVDSKRSRFEYLRLNEATGEAEIVYHLEFTAGERHLLFEGRKFMQKDAGGGLRAAAEVLEDYTTLHVRILEASAVTAAAAEGGAGTSTLPRAGAQREIGRGTLRFRTFENTAAVGNLSDFLLSFRVTGTNDPLLKMRARLAFLGLTARFVQEEYDPASLDIGSLRSDVRAEVARGAETPDFFSSRPTVELQSVLRETPTRPLAELLNTGNVRIDFAKRRIYRDSFWKGSFAEDTLLGAEEKLRTAALGGAAERLGRFFTGGSFWKRYDTLENGILRGHVVNYEMHAIPGHSEAREIEYPDNNRRYFRKGDKVLLMGYRNHPYRIVYDTIKVIDDENALGVMHLGEFPNGIEFAAFVMARQNYPYEKMAIDDHRTLMAHPQTRPPARDELEGNWRGTLVFLSTPNISLLNQANPQLFEADFRGGEASYRFRGGLDLGRPAAELRRIDEQTIIGCWNLPDLTPEPFLALQNYIGSTSQGLEVRFVLTRG
jgi:cholesterol oxidase